MVKDFGEKKKLGVHNTKETTNLTERMDMESTDGFRETGTKEIFRMISGMDMERCFGLMDRIIKVLGLKEFRKEREKLNFLMGLLSQEFSETTNILDP